MIDSHVHCRDRDESSKETIEHALSVAKDSGLSGIIDKPNTKPLATTKKEIEIRFSYAKQAQSRIFGESYPVFYGIDMGVIPDKGQLKEAIETRREYFPKVNSRFGVTGLKMFAGKSIGDLAIIEEEKQLLVYKTLAELGYEGVLVVHCEKEKYIDNKLWNPEKSSSHNLARPELSETESIKDQINFALQAHYNGHLHIAHVSTLESVELMDKESSFLDLSCGVTPHHLLLDTLTMDTMRDGALWKVNPPLRKPETRKKLLKSFLEGKIDILESDHAPHTYAEKTEDYLSGIPNLASWPDFIRLLKKEGMEDSLLEKVAYENVCGIYNINVPKLNFPVKSRVNEYAFDSYKPLK